MTLRRPPSPVVLANEKVAIASVLRLLHVRVSDEQHHRKVHCPFERFNHSDAGRSPSVRLYADSNTCWCYSCHAGFTPVKLYAQARDMTWTEAATALLDHVGYKPVSLAQHWQQLISYEPVPDRTLLASALTTYCERVIPDWSTRQFDPAEAALLTRCLALLDRIRSPQDAQQWLSATKTAMSRQFAPAHSVELTNASVDW